MQHQEVDSSGAWFLPAPSLIHHEWKKIMVLELGCTSWRKGKSPSLKNPLSFP